MSPNSRKNRLPHQVDAVAGSGTESQGVFAPMDDLSLFIAEAPWFATDEPPNIVGFSHLRQPFTAVLAQSFPSLSRLLSLATVTDILSGGESYELLAWDFAGDQRGGWLCPSPAARPSTDLFLAHQHLVREFGGISELFNGPDTWLSNHEEALKNNPPHCDATFIEHFAELLDEGTVWPIDQKDFYAIATEANGNTTLCHRLTGDVVLWAPDHDFDHIVTLAGLPEYTLYRINGAPTFNNWVEAIAEQWLDAITTSADR